MTGSANLFNTIKLPSKIHFIGVGGAGMSPLAGICLKNKIKVTGSDNSFGKVVRQLQDEGADIWTPHSLAELQKRDLPEVCVYSTAILPSNEEFAYLQEKGVTFWHRSDLLQKIAEQFEKQIVISGTHGKTTTTAMLIWILEKAGLKPCWVLGGVLKGLGSSGWNDDQREIFVFEGDESDQSFLKSNPYIGLVTSLEPDHLENYNNSFEVQIEKFQEFAKKSKHFICSESCKEGNLLKVAKVVYGSNRELHNLLSQQNYWYFNPENNNSISVHELGENFVDNRGQIHLKNISGEHNHLNALGSLAVLHLLLNNKNSRASSDTLTDSDGTQSKVQNDSNQVAGGETSKQAIQGAIGLLEDFPGIYRRFEIIGKTENNITVIDDYAHHPTEVEAAIKAGKSYLYNQKLGGKLIVAFQPHLPTRLRDLWIEFTECFEESDLLFLNDLYIARGEPIPGIDSEHLAAEIKHTNLTYVPGPPENLLIPISSKANPNDLILLLGAGDITRIRETLLQNLRQKVSW